MLFVLVLLNRCSGENDSYIRFREFPVEYNLRAEPLFPLYTHGASIDLFDSLLFIANPYDKEYFIRIYNKNSLELYYEFLKRGKGPYEMNFCGRVALDRRNKFLWVSDINHNDLWGFHIDSLINEGSSLPSMIVHLPDKVYPIFEFHCYDSLFYLPVLGGGTGFMVFNAAGKEICQLETVTFKEFENLLGTELNRTLSNVFPKKKKIITTYRYFDRLVIWDINGDDYRVVIGPDLLDIEEQLKGDDYARIEAYFPYYPRADHQYIYAQYNGKPGMMIDKEQGTRHSNYGNKIHVFSWDGEPVARLNLDHQLISFEIDTLENRIIAFATDADTTVVEYDISGFIK